jgi:hypothetical protein
MEPTSPLVGVHHKIVIRWIELVSKAVSTHHIPTNYREAMLLALENREKLEAASELHSQYR